MPSKKIDSFRFSTMRLADLKNGAVMNEVIETLQYYEARIKLLETALYPFAEVAPDTCRYSDKQMCMVGASIPAGHFKRAYRVLLGQEPCESKQ